MVGAGPAGLATAIHLALRGLPVRIREKRTSVQDKPCGEGIPPVGVAHLKALGVEPEHFPFLGVAYNTAEGVRAQVEFPLGPGWGIRRTALSAALRGRAAELGVPLELGSPVTELPADRMVVGADGLHSRVRKLAGLERPGRRHLRWGARQHFRVRPWSQFVEVHLGPGVEAYLTPVSHEVVGASFLWSPHRVKPRGELIPALLQYFPALAHLREAPVASQTAAIGPLEQRSYLVRGNVALVGDASGYLDAITGEGISLALGQAEALARAIAAGDLELYRRDYQTLTRPYYQVTSLILWLSQRPRLAARVVGALSHSDGFFRHLVSASMGARPLWRPPFGELVRFGYHLALGTGIRRAPGRPPLL